MLTFSTMDHWNTSSTPEASPTSTKGASVKFLFVLLPVKFDPKMFPDPSITTNMYPPIAPPKTLSKAISLAKPYCKSAQPLLSFSIVDSKIKQQFLRSLPLHHPRVQPFLQTISRAQTSQRHSFWNQPSSCLQNLTLQPFGYKEGSFEAAFETCAQYLSLKCGDGLFEFRF